MTQQYAWNEQFAKIERHNFIYSEIKCTPLALKELCRIHRVDIVLCFDYELQSKFSLEYHNEILALDIPWLLPTYISSEIENKFKFNAWMHENNFNHYLPKNKHLTDYPHVLKTGNGYSAKYVFLVQNAADLSTLDFNLDRRQYICQEYIPGAEEYAYHFVAVNGDIIKQETYKHIFSDIIQDQYYIKGRGFFNKSIQRVYIETEHEHALKEIIKALAFTGAGCIDFKIHDQHLYILEFNSRMGGSLIFFDAILNDFDSYLAANIRAINALKS